jgi:iron(III) transport system substrate-binding protein
LVRKDEVTDVARSFLDWAISDQAMTAYGASRVLLATPVEDHWPPPDLPEDPLTLLYDKDFAWASANRERIVAEWVVRYGGGEKDAD